MGIKLHNACMLVPACDWLLCSIKLLFALLYICVFLDLYFSVMDRDASKFWPKCHTMMRKLAKNVHRKHYSNIRSLM